MLLQYAENQKSEDHKHRSQRRRKYQSGSGTHANRSHNKDRGRRRHSLHAFARVQNRARADETDARDDLGRNPRLDPDPLPASNAESMVNNAEPKHMNILVRSPAGRCFIWRSRPIAPPRAAATIRRCSTIGQP